MDFADCLLPVDAERHAEPFLQLGFQRLFIHGTSADGRRVDSTAVDRAPAQLLPALLGALLGILAGIGIYDAAKTGGATTLPSALSLVAMVVVTLLAIAVLTAVPTRIAVRRPVAEALQAEGA